MSDIIIKIKKPSNIQKTLDKAKSEIEKNGGTLQGDTKSGTITGTALIGEIQGKYEVGDSHITVTVTKKPWIYPPEKVEEAITKAFRKWAVN
jgi:hypothetical protein